MRLSSFKRGWTVKVLSWVVALTFLPNNASYSAFTNPAPSAPISQPIPQTELSVSELLDINIPEAWGSVRERFEGKADKLVILSQDIHANFEAQRNFASIMEFLQKGKTAGNIDLVALEGAASEIDVSIMKILETDKELRTALLDQFIKEGYVNGADTFLIETESAARVVGVETPALYRENLAHFRNVYKIKGQVQPIVDQIRMLIGLLKPKVFTPALLEMVNKQEAQEGGKMTFTDYCKFLGEQAKAAGVNSKRYENFDRVLQTIAREAQIDSAKVQTERTAFMALLQGKMVKEDMAALVAKSLHFRLGRISAADFYLYLEETAQKKGVQLSRYPNLTQYIQNVKLHAKLDMTKLFAEIEQLASDVKNELFKNPEQRQMDALIQQISVLDKLLRLHMSRRDLAYYREHKDQIDGKRFVGFLQKIVANTGLAVTVPENWASITDQLQEMEAFYDVAIQRDDALTQNTLDLLEKTNKKAVVLACGGFHTQGITAQLKAKNIPYIVITPRITSQAEEEIYLSRMMNEETPLMKLLAGTGNRLAIADIFSEQLGNGDITKEVFLQSFAALALEHPGLIGEFNQKLRAKHSPIQLVAGKDNDVIILVHTTRGLDAMRATRPQEGQQKGIYKTLLSKGKHTVALAPATPQQWSQLDSDVRFRIAKTRRAREVQAEDAASATVAKEAPEGDADTKTEEAPVVEADQVAEDELVADIDTTLAEGAPAITAPAEVVAISAQLLGASTQSTSLSGESAPSTQTAHKGAGQEDQDVWLEGTAWGRISKRFDRKWAELNALEIKVQTDELNPDANAAKNGVAAALGVDSSKILITIGDRHDDLNGASAQYKMGDDGSLRIILAKDVVGNQTYLKANLKFEIQKGLLGLTHIEAMNWTLIEEDLKRYEHDLKNATGAAWDRAYRGLKQLMRDISVTQDATREKYYPMILARIRRNNPGKDEAWLVAEAKKLTDAALRNRYINGVKAQAVAVAVLNAVPIAVPPDSFLAKVFKQFKQGLSFIIFGMGYAGMARYGPTQFASPDFRMVTAVVSSSLGRNSSVMKVISESVTKNQSFYEEIKPALKQKVEEILRAADLNIVDGAADTVGEREELIQWLQPVLYGIMGALTVEEGDTTAAFEAKVDQIIFLAKWLYKKYPGLPGGAVFGEALVEGYETIESANRKKAPEDIIYELVKNLEDQVTSDPRATYVRIGATNIALGPKVAVPVSASTMTATRLREVSAEVEFTRGDVKEDEKAYAHKGAGRLDEEVHLSREGFLKVHEKAGALANSPHAKKVGTALNGVLIDLGLGDVSQDTFDVRVTDRANLNGASAQYLTEYEADGVTVKKVHILLAEDMVKKGTYLEANLRIEINKGYNRQPHLEAMEGALVFEDAERYFEWANSDDPTLQALGDDLLLQLSRPWTVDLEKYTPIFEARYGVVEGNKRLNAAIAARKQNAEQVQLYAKILRARRNTDWVIARKAIAELATGHPTLAELAYTQFRAIPREHRREDAQVLPAIVRANTSGMRPIFTSLEDAKTEFNRILKEDFKPIAADADEMAREERMLEAARELLNKRLNSLIDTLDPETLRIRYHDIQHSVEVTIGQLRMMAVRYKQNHISEVDTPTARGRVDALIIGTTAALDHDGGYLPVDEGQTIYEFLGVKEDEVSAEQISQILGMDGVTGQQTLGSVFGQFVKQFKPDTYEYQTDANRTAGQFTSSHVFRGQILMRLIRAKEEKWWEMGTVLQKRWVGQMDAVGHLITHTDLFLGFSPKGAGKLGVARAHLANKGLLGLARTLEVADLYTQMSKQEYVAKLAELYREFRDTGLPLGFRPDAVFSSNQGLVAGTAGFNEGMAMPRLDRQAMADLREYFQSPDFQGESQEDPYAHNYTPNLLLTKMLGDLERDAAQGYDPDPASMAMLDSLQDVDFGKDLQGNAIKMEPELRDYYRLRNLMRQGKTLENAAEDLNINLAKIKDWLLLSNTSEEAQYFRAAYGDDYRRLLFEDAMMAEPPSAKTIFEALDGYDKLGQLMLHQADWMPYLSRSPPAVGVSVLVYLLEQLQERGVNTTSQGVPAALATFIAAAIDYAQQNEGTADLRVALSKYLGAQDTKFHDVLIRQTLAANEKLADYAKRYAEQPVFHDLYLKSWMNYFSDSTAGQQSQGLPVGDNFLAALAQSRATRTDASIGFMGPAHKVVEAFDRSVDALGGTESWKTALLGTYARAFSQQAQPDAETRQKVLAVALGRNIAEELIVRELSKVQQGGQANWSEILNFLKTLGDQDAAEAWKILSERIPMNALGPRERLQVLRAAIAAKQDAGVIAEWLLPEGIGVDYLLENHEELRLRLSEADPRVRAEVLSRIMAQLASEAAKEPKLFAKAVPLIAEAIVILHEKYTAGPPGTIAARTAGAPFNTLNGTLIGLLKAHPREQRFTHLAFLRQLVERLGQSVGENFELKSQLALLAGQRYASAIAAWGTNIDKLESNIDGSAQNPLAMLREVIGVELADQHTARQEPEVEVADMPEEAEFAMASGMSKGMNQVDSVLTDAEKRALEVDGAEKANGVTQWGTDEFRERGGEAALARLGLKLDSRVDDQGYATVSNLDGTNKKRVRLFHAEKDRIRGNGAWFRSEFDEDVTIIVLASNLESFEVEHQFVHEFSEAILGESHAEAVVRAGFGALQGDLKRAVDALKEAIDSKDKAKIATATLNITTLLDRWLVTEESQSKYFEQIAKRVGAKEAEKARTLLASNTAARRLLSQQAQVYLFFLLQQEKLLDQIDAVANYSAVQDAHKAVQDASKSATDAESKAKFTAFMAALGRQKGAFNLLGLTIARRQKQAELARQAATSAPVAQAAPAEKARAALDTTEIMSPGFFARAQAWLADSNVPRVRKTAVVAFVCLALVGLIAPSFLFAGVSALASPAFSGVYGIVQAFPMSAALLPLEATVGSMVFGGLRATVMDMRQVRARHNALARELQGIRAEVKRIQSELEDSLTDKFRETTLSVSQKYHSTHSAHTDVSKLLDRVKKLELKLGDARDSLEAARVVRSPVVTFLLGPLIRRQTKESEEEENLREDAFLVRDVVIRSLNTLSAKMETRMWSLDHSVPDTAGAVEILNIFIEKYPQYFQGLLSKGGERVTVEGIKVLIRNEPDDYAKPILTLILNRVASTKFDLEGELTEGVMTDPLRAYVARTIYGYRQRVDSAAMLVSQLGRELSAMDEEAQKRRNGLTNLQKNLRGSSKPDAKTVAAALKSFLRNFGYGAEAPKEPTGVATDLTAFTAVRRDANGKLLPPQLKADIPQEMLDRYFKDENLFLFSNDIDKEEARDFFENLDAQMKARYKEYRGERASQKPLADLGYYEAGLPVEYFKTKMAFATQKHVAGRNGIERDSEIAAIPVQVVATMEKALELDLARTFMVQLFDGKTTMLAGPMIESIRPLFKDDAEWQAFLQEDLGPLTPLIPETRDDIEKAFIGHLATEVKA